jgi:hypothetical protein
MPQSPPTGFQPPETAQYTYEMLESLGKIALRQHQDLLAHLLSLAALEAKALMSQGDQQTSLPG